MAGNDFSEEVKLFPALSRTEFFIIQIVKLIVLKQEHEDTILILQQQKIDYKDEIDLYMNELEMVWRTKEKEAIKSKIEYPGRIIRYMYGRIRIVFPCNPGR